MFIGARVLSSVEFGEGSGPILLADLMCSTLENRLVDCSHSGFENNSCSHEQDVGIRCKPGKIKFSDQKTFFTRSILHQLMFLLHE